MESIEKPKQPSVDYNKLRPLQPEKPAEKLADVDLRQEANRIKRELKDPRTVWEIFQALKQERYGSPSVPKGDS